MQRLADLVAAEGTWAGRRDLRRKCTETAIGQHTLDLGRIILTLSLTLCRNKLDRL